MNPAEQMLEQAVAYHKVGNIAQAVQIYNQLLNLEPFNPGVLYLMGDAAVRQGLNGMGINLLSNAIAVKPTAEAYVALGCAYKAEGYGEEALRAWNEGLNIQPSAELYNNIASMYSDAAQPALAHMFVEKALKFGRDNPNALWNRALAYLTEGRWPEGWADHEQRFHPNVQTVSTRRNYGCPEWDGRPNVRLAVHGEQGIGDEVMFLSMLPEVLARCPDTVIEVEPRLMDLVERNFGIPTYGNEAAMRAHEKPFDMSIPIGSLGKLLRLDDSDFPGTPYLTADPARVALWRQRYAGQGPGPYIGVAWQGGGKTTRIRQRTIQPAQLAFAKKGTAISLQYGEFAEPGARANGFCFWVESTGLDMEEFCAMVAACDMIVTVPQTLVHVAGALGVPCQVLTPLYSSWRYGMTDRMPWYNSVKLLRQRQDNNWGYPLDRARQAVDALCRGDSHVDQ